MNTRKINQSKSFELDLTLIKRKMIINSLILFITAIMFGCSSFHFDNDMPLQTASLKEFNTDLIGNYNLNDSILKLADDVYYNSRYRVESYKNLDSFSLIKVDLTISKMILSYIGEVKNYYKLGKVDTSLIARKHKEEQKTIENGFLIITENFDDTLLNLDTKDNLKMYGNKFYLNAYVDEHDWEIYQLEITKNFLLSLNMVNESDKKQLKNQLIKKNETIGDIVHLTNPQFYSFIKKGGFRTKYKFKKNSEGKLK